MDGIIVGSDLTQEWLLPWWWEHYRKHNSYPVAFIDLGMSFEMKDWCKARGEHIPLRMFDFAVEKEDVDPSLVQQWKEEFGSHIWDCRSAWFKKPLACLKSPFQRTIWIDLDCEIRGPLNPLFEYADPPPCLAMAINQRDPPYPIYNSGVIVFCRDTLPLIKEWADQCFEQNRSFPGDQEVLSYLIAEKGIEILELPARYNWSRRREDHPATVIHHWHGAHGKYVIRNLLQFHFK